MPLNILVSMDCLHRAEVLIWPGRSTNLSPIEHVWNQLGHQLRTSANLQDLEGQLQQLWAESIQRPYNSLSHQITGCIQAQEWHTQLTWDQKCARTANTIICLIWHCLTSQSCHMTSHHVRLGHFVGMLNIFCYGLYVNFLILIVNFPYKKILLNVE